jgi:dUTP pyrophosphatase
MAERNSVDIQCLCPEAKIPERGSTGAVGYDLVASQGCVILPGSRQLVPTGLAMAIPTGYYGRIAPRSGLAVKHGIDVGAGVIDCDYRGEIKVLLFNLGQEPFLVKPGYKIAQMVFEVCRLPSMVQVEQLNDTDRGEGGFGSTGA